MRWPHLTIPARLTSRLRAAWRATERFRHDERGAQTVEYAMLTALVVIILLVAVEALFGAVSDLIDRVREGISQIGGAAP